jgi:hypothetical protein
MGFAMTGDVVAQWLWKHQYFGVMTLSFQLNKTTPQVCDATEA